MTDVSTTVVRPGDTLIVSVPKALTDEEARHLAEQIEETLSGVHVAILEQVSGLAVYRPDNSEKG